LPESTAGFTIAERNSRAFAMRKPSRRLPIWIAALLLGLTASAVSAKQPKDKDREYYDDYPSARQSDGNYYEGDYFAGRRYSDNKDHKDRKGDYSKGDDDSSRGAPRMSLDEAVGRAQRQTGGRVLSAELVERHGHPNYRVKVLTDDGRVRILYMDARSNGGR
jgi:uncharacterized membrane protein YkoI